MIKPSKPNKFQIGDIVSYGQQCPAILRYLVTGIVDNRTIRLIAIDDTEGVYIEADIAIHEQGYAAASSLLTLVWRCEDEQND